MAVRNFAPGKIRAILYFQNERGIIQMLPTDEECLRFRKAMRKMGFEMYAAETIREAEKLQTKMQEQLRAEQQRELTMDEITTARGRAAVGDRLRRKLASSLTSEYEKDFIRAYLEWRENKHEVFKKRFTSQIGHLDGLEFDNPNEHISNLLDRV